jgi:hypothetical protein
MSCLSKTALQPLFYLKDVAEIAAKIAAEIRGRNCCQNCGEIAAKICGQNGYQFLYACQV